MLLLGHVAAGTVVARWANEKADLRWIIFLSLLPDLIDKPLGLIIFRETINNGRVFFRSLLVNILLTFLLILWRRPLVYPLILWVHQFCDLMWTRPWVALWPLTGSFSYRNLPLAEWGYQVLNPYNVISEIVGMIVLLFLVVRHYRRFDIIK